jgi:hypothetical protein
LNKAVITFPLDPDGGILAPYFMPFWLLIGAIVAKVSGLHPMMLWQLSPVILAPLSVFIVFVLIRFLTKSSQAGILSIWGLVIFSLAHGLHYTGVDAWTNWWPSILFPRNIVYYLLTPLGVFLLLRHMEQKIERYGKDFWVLLSICLMGGLNNLPAGIAMIGQMMLICALPPLLYNQEKLVFSWWRSLLLIGATMVPSSLLILYGSYYMPPKFLMNSHHRNYMQNLIGTYANQPELWLFAGIILGSLYWIRWKRSIVVLCISFLCIVSPFFLPQFRAVINQIFSTPVVFTRMMIYMPFWGAICTLTVLFSIGYYFKKVIKINIFFILILMTPMFFWLHYPSNMNLMDYRLNKDSRYNMIVTTMFQRGKELHAVLKNLNPCKRILVAGNPDGMGQFMAKEIQMITGRDLSPLLGFEATSKTFLARPDFGTRNMAAWTVAKMLDNPQPADLNWRLKFERELTKAKIGYILFFLQNGYVKDRDSGQRAFDKLTDNYAKINILFNGKYSHIVEISP